ncbi:MAG: hypothetical protein M1490_02715, partial [Candidatus Bathyarchaeota archaeon]|nr:hypothetical protein [Candidatus Bathyarchaeota archaeon]
MARDALTGHAHLALCRHLHHPLASTDSHQPAQLKAVLGVFEGIQKEFNGAQLGGKRVSFADLIVLGGCV